MTIRACGNNDITETMSVRLNDGQCMNVKGHNLVQQNLIGNRVLQAAYGREHALLRQV
jgi:hypothetical protein